MTVCVCVCVCVCMRVCACVCMCSTYCRHPIPTFSVIDPDISVVKYINVQKKNNKAIVIVIVTVVWEVCAKNSVIVFLCLNR